MSKSDSLKNGMRSGLDGLLSSTGKSTQKKEPAPVKAEKEPAVHCNFVIDKSIHTRMKYLAIEKNMSLRNIVNEAMKEYLEKHEKYPGRQSAQSTFIPYRYLMAHVHKVAVFPFIPLAVLLLYSPLIAAMLHFPFLSIPLAACPVSFLPSPVGFPDANLDCRA